MRPVACQVEVHEICHKTDGQPSRKSMNANPDTSTNGPARMNEHEDDFHEARLWSRARRNLTLLYAGRSGCCATFHGHDVCDASPASGALAVPSQAPWAPRQGCPIG